MTISTFPKEINYFFCIAPTHGVSWMTGRIDAAHSLVYHGEGHRSENDDTRQSASQSQWVKDIAGGVRYAGPSRPSVNNDVRVPMRLWRSGAFVPDAFMTSDYSLIISKTLAVAIQKHMAIEFMEVIFRKLIDLPMPAVGDFSWSNKIQRTGEIDKCAADLLDDFPDCKEYHETIGSYYEIIPMNLSHDKKRYSDTVKYRPDFGTYHGYSCDQGVLFSATAIRGYPIIWGNVLCLREDLFEVIAPHVDLDYFSIAIVYV